MSAFRHQLFIVFHLPHTGYLFIYLFIQYFKRVALLAKLASLPSGPQQTRRQLSLVECLLFEFVDLVCSVFLVFGLGLVGSF